MDNQPIIIKKVKKVSHGGHHGGSWKVAYADFVTAMMAFFLLLWLLNVTSKEQRQGIADYFSPASVSATTSGAGGVLGGRTVIVDGSKMSEKGSQSVVIGMAPIPKDEPKENSPPADEEINKRLIEREQETFKQAEDQLRQAMQESPESLELQQHLLIDMTPEGLRIQLVDQDRQSMFPSGSAAMTDRAKKLMAMVSKVVQKMPNKLSISGHTDAQQFRSEQGYGNWELSSDRANASRRALIEGGINAARIRQVSGKAEQEPLLSDNPNHASNRRISIVLLRETPLVPLPGTADQTSSEGKPLPSGLPARSNHLPPPLRR